MFFDDALRQFRSPAHVPSPIRLKVASAMLCVASAAAGEKLLYEGQTHHLIRHWVGNAANDESYAEWATAEVIDRIPAYLLRATELSFDLFRAAHIGLEIQARVREQVFAKAKTELTPMTPQTFASCFPPHFPYTLSHLVRLDSKSANESLRTRLEDWEWLKPQLLAGLRDRPEVITPHVLPLFGTFGPHPGPYETYKFDDEAVSLFFGPDRADLQADRDRCHSRNKSRRKF